MVKVAGRRGDAGVAELLGDDADVDALGAKLGGMRVPQAMSVDVLLDAGPDRKAGQQTPDVGLGDPGPVQAAEDRAAAVDAEADSRAGRLR